jgi:hypothetical protein
METSSVTPSTLKDTLSPHDMTSKGMKSSISASDKPGFRAAEAYVRPYPIAVHGDLVSYGFDLRNCTFTLSLNAPSSTKQEAPTKLFLPEFHFPPNESNVEVSGGQWSISTDDDNNDGGDSLIQVLKWWHADGEQRITIKGVKRRNGMELSQEEEEGYLEQCQQSSSKCKVM